MEALQAAYTPILAKFGEGRQEYVRVGGKHCKYMASLYKHNMGKIQRIVRLRHESKFRKVKSLHLIHSARLCKNCVPKYSHFPSEFINKTFFLSA